MRRSYGVKWVQSMLFSSRLTKKKNVRHSKIYFKCLLNKMKGNIARLQGGALAYIKCYTRS